MDNIVLFSLIYFLNVLILIKNLNWSHEVIETNLDLSPTIHRNLDLMNDNISGK